MEDPPAATHAPIKTERENTETAETWKTAQHRRTTILPSEARPIDTWWFDSAYATDRRAPIDISEDPHDPASIEYREWIIASCGRLLEDPATFRLCRAIEIDAMAKRDAAIAANQDQLDQATEMLQTQAREHELVKLALGDMIRNGGSGNGGGAEQQQQQRPAGFFPKTTDLPTFEGSPGLDAVTGFLDHLRRRFTAHSMAIGWVDASGQPRTEGWGSAAAMQCRGLASSWVARTFPVDNVDWEDFIVKLKAQYIPPDALMRLRADWDALVARRGERITAFNERFLAIRHQLDPHDPFPASLKLGAYVAKLRNRPDAETAVETLRSFNPAADLAACMRQAASVDRLHALTATTTTAAKPATSKPQLRVMEAVPPATLAAPAKAPGRWGNRTYDTPISCFCCGERGHRAPDCQHRHAFRDLVRDRINAGRTTAPMAGAGRGGAGGTKAGTRGADRWPRSRGGKGRQTVSARLAFQQAPETREDDELGEETESDVGGYATAYDSGNDDGGR